MSNSDNPKYGALFQKQVMKWFQDHFEKSFELDKKIPIGNPPKEHKFDIVDLTGTIAIECKRYTWTETGNVPSAKMGFTNEAAFYLSLLPNNYDKYIVMLKARHAKRTESLAEYYYRMNKHLLGNIITRAVICDVQSLGDCRFELHHPHLLSFHSTTALPARPLLF